MRGTLETIQNRLRSEPGTEIRRWATIGGVGILLIAALSIFANFLVLERLVTSGDATRTATDIASSKGLFQAGIFGWVLIAVLDVLVAVALFGVLSPVNRRVAMIAAWARVLYGAVLGIAILRLVGALAAANGQATSGSSRDVLRNVEGFTDIWNVGLILFGIHLFLAGYLAFRSGYISKLVGALVALAGFGYLFDAAVRALVDDAASLSVITGLGEFVFGVWLVIRGRRIALAPAAPASAVPGITTSTATEGATP
jgi:hypothetical protein